LESSEHHCLSQVSSFGVEGVERTEFTFFAVLNARTSKPTFEKKKIMYQLADLIESNLLYQYLTDKLEFPNELKNKTVEEACSRMDLNVSFFETLLLTYEENSPFPEEELNSFSIETIISYLKKAHQFYLYKKLPEIELSAKHLVNNYFSDYPLLPLLSTFFIEYKQKLEQHILFEERVFFPYIKELIQKKNKQIALTKTAFPQFSTKVFLKGHTDLESGLKEIRNSLIKYKPTNATKTPLPYKIFLTQLHYLEIDLQKHALIEDAILVKKVLELEEELELEMRFV
jgi:regulator of cell morphogenesis and NO signaling